MKQEAAAAGPDLMRMFALQPDLEAKLFKSRTYVLRRVSTLQGLLVYC